MSASSPTVRLIAPLLLGTLLALGGCASTDGDDDSEASALDVSYDGNAAAADIEAVNATALARTVFGLTGTVDVLPQGAGDAAADAVGIVSAAGHLRGAIVGQPQVVAVAGVHPFVSVMEACEDGGERVTTTDGDRLSIEYFDCEEDGVTLDGSLERVGTDDDNVVTVPGIRLVAGGVDLGFSGSFSFADAGDSERLTLTDLVVVDNTGGRSLRAQNLVITETAVIDGDEITLNGRLFDSELGYIDVETADGDPLFIANTDAYPSDGLVILTGQNGESAVIMPLSSTQVNFVVDTDGDSVADIDETVTWAEVEAAIGLT